MPATAGVDVAMNTHLKTVKLVPKGQNPVNVKQVGCMVIARNKQLKGALEVLHAAVRAPHAAV